jgi:hypothetical protein
MVTRLSGFVSLFPDETLYSGIGRFRDHEGYESDRTLLTDLFGKTTLTAVMDLPCHLLRLVERLPDKHPYAVKDLIDNHTVLPFYSRFLHHDRMVAIRKDMATGFSTAIHARAGLMAGRIRLPDYAQSCDACVDSDIALYGEPYWHRVHQLPGILVCALHGNRLRRVLALRTRGQRHSFVPVRKALQSNSGHIDL